MVNPWYTTREAVKAATDDDRTTFDNVQVDKCIEAASRSVEGALHRKFYPWVGTRYFPYPTLDNRGYRLWLDEHDLISVTTFTSGGTALTASDYFLEPINSGPPFEWVELDLGAGSSFNVGSTWQRNIAIAGLWGYSDTYRSDGALTEALDDSETSVDVDGATSALVGVGSILKVDSERMIVKGRTLLDTTVNIGGNLSDSKAVTTVPVASGAAFAIGEVIVVDAESMLIVDIAGNNLIVKRAYDGSPLAAHTNGADIYSSRTLLVERGSLGTTAAAHNTSTAVYTWIVPGLVEELCIAEVLVMMNQRASGYARTVGSGESERESGGRGLIQIRKEAMTAHGRHILHSAV